MIKDTKVIHGELEEFDVIFLVRFDVIGLLVIEEPVA